ncbi:MAG: FecR family protein [Candidatus Muiribacteriota bacterium]
MKKITFLMLILLIMPSIFIHANVSVETAVLSYVYGIVKVKAAGETEWKDAKLNMVLNIGDSIKTARRSKAEINISDKKIISVNPNTVVEIPEVVENQSGILQTLKLFFGFIYVNGKKIDGELNVQTPRAICGVRGTRFTLQVSGPREILTVLAGRVHYGTYNNNVSRVVNRGQQISVAKNDQVQQRAINAVREENKVIREFIQKESSKIESIKETIQDVNTRPTETLQSKPSSQSGSLHIEW